MKLSNRGTCPMARLMFRVFELATGNVNKAFAHELIEC